MTYVNILLYSDKVESEHVKHEKTIIPKSFRVAFNSFVAYKVGDFENSIESLLDVESHMINTDYIDEKIMKLKMILPNIEGKNGVLRMENYTPQSTDVTFELEE